MMTIEFRSEGAFVAPDRLQQSCDGEVFGLVVREYAIVIGDQVWVRNSQMNGEFIEGTPQFCGPDLSPVGLTEDFDGDELIALDGTLETVNGIESVRYDLDESFLEKIASLTGTFGDPGDLDDLDYLPEDFAFDVWIWLARDGGWPVKAEFQVSGSQDGGAF
jgi:hypothetical protein